MRLLPADEIERVGDAPIELKNGNQAQVVHGLEAGARVVMYPPADLADGMRVTSSNQAGPAE